MFFNIMMYKINEYKKKSCILNFNADYILLKINLRECN